MSTTAAAPLSGRALQERLDERVGLAWQQKPLREGLYQFARARDVGVLLDRRVDPGRPIDLALGGVPVREALSRIAAAGGVRGTWVGPLAYFGPEEVVSRVPALIERTHEKIRALPPAVARRWVARKSLEWPRFATPRELVEQLAAEGRVEVDQLDRVPHDLWAEAALPPLPLCDRLAVVLLQFGLTFEPSRDGRRITLVPLPDDLPAESVAADTPSAQSPQRAATTVDPELIRIDRLAIEQVPVGAVLRQVAQQTGLRLQVDEAAIERAGLSLDTFIAVRVENVTLDELLARVVEGTGLACRREGRTVYVVPAGE